MGVRQATFFVSLHSTGAAPRAIPSLFGPRQRGQSSSAAASGPLPIAKATAQPQSRSFISE
jgi:hypothetical protein